MEDLIADLEEKHNDKKYKDKIQKSETQDTGVIYLIYNVNTKKAYIGKAYSYVKNGNQPIRKHGANDRFERHWTAAHNGENDCPVFYEALRDSDIDDWRVYTLGVCSKKHLCEKERRYIELYRSSNPKYGYNFFVGTKKPDDEGYLEKYQTKKAQSNAKRAIGGKLRKKEHSQDLPPNIHYRAPKNKNGKQCGEGYFVQIKLNGVLYNKAFLSSQYTMEQKLDQAKAQLEFFRKQAAKLSGSKTAKLSVKSAKSAKSSGSKTAKSSVKSAKSAKLSVKSAKSSGSKTAKSSVKSSSKSEKSSGSKTAKSSVKSSSKSEKSSGSKTAKSNKSKSK
jgi:hypothetical protein